MFWQKLILVYYRTKTLSLSDMQISAEILLRKKVTERTQNNITKRIELHAQKYKEMFLQK